MDPALSPLATIEPGDLSLVGIPLAILDAVLRFADSVGPFLWPLLVVAVAGLALLVRRRATRKRDQVARSSDAAPGDDLPADPGDAGVGILGDRAQD